ncbi:XkdX family protein [Fructobacillus sp. M158]|nr:XkdX family protein [Fructobacillus parabroussonetiae]MCK8617949.1 XkdX family protein [Fructobacillus parabroussonetiae]
MNLSTTGQTIKYYFDNLGWSVERVKKTVKAGWISKDEYREITGEEYTE